MFGIKCALPSSGHWGIRSLSPTSNGPVLHAGTAHPSAFSVNIGGTPQGQGFLVNPPPLSQWGDGDGGVTVPWGCCQLSAGMATEAHSPSSALAHPGRCSPMRGCGTATGYCVAQQKTQGVESLWGSYISEQSSFCISSPLQGEALACGQEWILELPQKLHPDYQQVY